MKNLKNIDMVEMNELELEGSAAGWFGKGDDLAFIIFYITVVKIPGLVFA